jgi:uncharacterized protein YaaR (DUF327 family)
LKKTEPHKKQEQIKNTQIIKNVIKNGDRLEKSPPINKVKNIKNMFRNSLSPNILNISL